MRTDLLFGITITLLREGKCKLNYLAEKFEVSSKTISRYLLALEMSGVPTRSFPGRNGGTEIIDVFKLDNIFFTKDESARILSHLYNSPTNLIDKLDLQLIEKIKFQLKDYTEELDNISKNIFLDYSNWGLDAKDNKHLLKLQNAIKENRAIIIKYFSPYSKDSTRIISPYRLILKDNKWYLVAFCHSKNCFRVFKTNRIKEVTRPEQQIAFINQKLDDTICKNLLTESFEKCNIVLETEESLLPDISDWVKIKKTKSNLSNNKKIIVGESVFNDGLVNKILSYGNSLKVLEPVELINKIFNKSSQILELYKEKIV